MWRRRGLRPTTWARGRCATTYSERYHANLGRLAVHLDATAADLPTTVCSPALRRVNGTHLTDRQLLRYMLHQSALPIRYTDCFSSVVLAAGGARQQITFTYGDGPAQVPEPLQSWFARAEETPIYGLPAGSAVVIEVAQPLGDLMGSFITTAPAGYPPEAPGGPGPASIPVRLGGNLTFEGYAVGATEAQPGDAVELVTYWRVDGPTPPDLNMFTHLLFDPDGSPVAQADLLGPIAATLRPSDIFAQVHYLSLPARLLPDDYDLVIGVVNASGGRLPVLDDGAERGTRLFLQQIHVTDGGGEGDG
ncbi:MAG: hypothetical protein M5R40_13750 [Anaerolineae bacterium]|nr:hypothetical protein [Anaerolineae bacterium]